MCDVKTFTSSAPVGYQGLHILFHWQRNLKLTVLAAVSMAFLLVTHAASSALPHIYLCYLRWVVQDINEGVLSNSPTLQIYSHKGVWYDARTHPVDEALPRRPDTSGCVGGWVRMCGVNVTSPNRIWILDCYLPKAWRRLEQDWNLAMLQRACSPVLT